VGEETLAREIKQKSIEKRGNSRGGGRKIDGRAKKGRNIPRRKQTPPLRKSHKNVGVGGKKKRERHWG